jgi:hypothetical protein
MLKFIRNQRQSCCRLYTGGAFRFSSQRNAITLEVHERDLKHWGHNHRIVHVRCRVAGPNGTYSEINVINTGGLQDDAHYIVQNPSFTPPFNSRFSLETPTTQS